MYRCGGHWRFNQKNVHVRRRRIAPTRRIRRDKKRRIRRNCKGENKEKSITKIKDRKTIEKMKNLKKLGRMGGM